MKKLALVALFLVVSAGLAQAQTTAKLGLYTDPNGQLTSCQAPIAIFGTDSVYLYYVKGNGHDLGFAVEFKGVLSNFDIGESDLVPAPRWSNLFTLSQGDLLNGISLTASQCLGVNQAYVLLGTIFVQYTGFDVNIPFTLRITQHPDTGDIRITRCDARNTIDVINGSWFVFNGTCDIGTAPKSWGAIKSLYK
jgi:hypothetical protein